MIRADELTFAYPGGAAALQHLSLCIEPGEHVAIIGANGSGKTTLARCLNGLLQPTSGQLTVDGLSPADPAALYDVRRLVGMVFQNPDDQLVSTTVETEIAFGLENLGVPRDEMLARVDEMLRIFHLERYRRHPPHQLSGGEKQRVAVAASVALRPRYLVLDEPTALLDPRNRAELMELLARLRRELGIAVVHITQSADEAARADRVLVLCRGLLDMAGPAAEVFSRPERLRAAGLGLPFAASACEGFVGAGSALALDLDSLIDLLPPPSLPRPPGLEREQDGTPGVAGGDRDVRPRLTVRDLWHVYDADLPTRKEALAGVDLTVVGGRALALLGPGGSGKTTLAQHLNGLLRPQRGSVWLDGSDVWAGGRPRSDLRRRVGLIFQFPELQLFEETVARDVAFGPRNLGLDEARTRQEVERALDLVGLPLAEFGERSPLSLSGGERRRAAIAGVLAMDPEVLVLDEPTAGLDPRAAGMLTGILRHLRCQGRALVLITHDMDLVAEVADDVVVLAAGRLALAGTARQVLCHPEFEARSGLEPPTAVLLARRLVARGYALPRGLLTLSETRQLLTSLLQRKDGDDPVH
ncbi:MAG: energy-coupling factor transporter ATPase [Gemmatimonadota bacterium]